MTWGGRGLKCQSMHEDAREQLPKAGVPELNWAILLAPSALDLETGLSLNLELASSIRLVSSRELPVSVSPALRLKACTPTVSFLFGIWDLNSGPHT